MMTLIGSLVGGLWGAVGSEYLRGVTVKMTSDRVIWYGRMN